MTMKPVLFTLISLVAGFLGGILGTRVARTRESSATQQVIRARKFELVDETGRAISYWGVDQDDYAVLAFGWYMRGVSEGSTDAPRSAPGGLANLRNERARFGVMGGLPFLQLRGEDGTARMSLSLRPFDEPILYMADATRPRLYLGVIGYDTLTPSHDWALTFEPDISGIGMRRRGQEGKTYEGFVFLNGRRVVTSPPQ